MNTRPAVALALLGLAVLASAGESTPGTGRPVGLVDAAPVDVPPMSGGRVADRAAERASRAARRVVGRSSWRGRRVGRELVELVAVVTLLTRTERGRRTGPLVIVAMLAAWMSAVTARRCALGFTAVVRSVRRSESLTAFAPVRGPDLSLISGPNRERSCALTC